MTDYKNPNSLGSYFRKKRVGPLLELVKSAFKQKGEVTMLDVGGRKEYWKILPSGTFEKYNVKVTVLNIPSDLQGEDDDVFSHISGNACSMPEFSDNSFDVVHSNSVIEHVGDWTQVKLFAQEVSRVSIGMFIQTPFYWFPIEPHYVCPFFHWLPRPIRISLMLRRTLGNRGRAKDLDTAMQYADEAPRLLDRRCYKLLFPDCDIINERIFLLTKSMIAYRARI